MHRISYICRVSVRSATNFSGDLLRSMSTKITHVIFDFDGVLLDTEKIFYEANLRCFEHYGLKYTSQLKQGQMGRPLIEGVKWLMNNTQLSEKAVTNQEYIKLYHKVVEKMLDNPREMPGASRLINHLYANKIPIAICTGSEAKEFKLKTKMCQHMLEKIPIIVTASDPEVKHGKPAPDPYLVTMKRFMETPKNPKNVLVFEDSINGVYSALAAGCSTIMVPQEEFKPANWNEIYDKIKPPRTADILNSLEKLDLQKYGLPLI